MPEYFGICCRTSAESASCGTHLGETKLVASITRRPAFASLSMSSILTLVRICSLHSRSKRPSPRPLNAASNLPESALCTCRLFLVLQTITWADFDYCDLRRQLNAEKVFLYRATFVSATAFIDPRLTLQLASQTSIVTNGFCIQPGQASQGPSTATSPFERRLASVLASRIGDRLTYIC